MRHFFTILFGGLAAIAIGVTVVWGAEVAFNTFSRQLFSLSGSPEVQAAPPGGVISTVSGLTKTVRYDADDEEGLINQSALTLPSGADNKITARAYLVEDITHDRVAAEFNQDRLLPIASLTKLVTAVVARRLIPADTRITITKQVMATYGNTADFRVGETFLASDLLYPLLLVSSNDAAESYAQEYGRPQFIQAMNAFTQSIGAYRTYFADPSGLSPLNESTANDLVIILNWIRQHDPEIIAVTALKSKTLRNHTWVNPTHFLSWSYYLGGKNGYTDEADRTGVGLFALGHPESLYVVVVLGSDNRDADMIRLLGKIK